MRYAQNTGVIPSVFEHVFDDELDAVDDGRPGRRFARSFLSNAYCAHTTTQPESRARRREAWRFILQI